MYIFHNKSLDDVFSKYNKRALFDFTNDELVDTCKSLAVAPLWVMKEVNGVPRRSELHRGDTIKLIETMKTFDMYVDPQYWTEDMLKIDEEFNLIGQLKTHDKGSQTFEMFANVRFGFYKLKPGESQKVNAPDEWLTDIFGQHPISNDVEVLTEDNKKVQFIIEKDEKDKVKSCVMEFVDVKQPNKKVNKPESLTSVTEKIGDGSNK